MDRCTKKEKCILHAVHNTKNLRKGRLAAVTHAKLFKLIIHAIDNGASKSSAAAKYNVSRRTVIRWWNSTKLASSFRLNSTNQLLKNEAKFIKILKWANKNRLPLTPYSIRKLGYQFGKIHEPRYSLENCKEFALSEKWWWTFRNRIGRCVKYEHPRVLKRNIIDSKKYLHARIISVNEFQNFPKNSIFIVSDAIKFDLPINNNIEKCSKITALICSDVYANFKKPFFFCSDEVENLPKHRYTIVNSCSNPLSEWFYNLHNCFRNFNQILLLICGCDNFWVDLIFLEQLMTFDITVIGVPSSICNQYDPLYKLCKSTVQNQYLEEFDKFSKSRKNMTSQDYFETFIQAYEKVTSDNTRKFDLNELYSSLQNCTNNNIYIYYFLCE